MTEQNTQEPQSEEAEATAPADTAIDDKVIAVAKQTMVGDLRDVCLQIMKDPKLTGKAWKDMSEAQQKEVVGTITDRMTDAVVNAVQVIAANGQRQVVGTLQQVVVKDGIKAVIEASKFDELRHELYDAQGEAVAIVLSGAEEFVGVGEKPKIDKDQPELPVEEEETEKEESNEQPDHDPDTGEINEEAETQLDREAADLT